MSNKPESTPLQPDSDRGPCVLVDVVKFDSAGKIIDEPDSEPRDVATPRTDELASDLGKDRSGAYLNNTPGSSFWTMVELARQLERETIELRQQLAVCRGALGIHPDEKIPEQKPQF